MSGAIPLLLLCAFVALTGTTLPYPEIEASGCFAMLLAIRTPSHALESLILAITPVATRFLACPTCHYQPTSHCDSVVFHPVLRYEFCRWHSIVKYLFFKYVCMYCEHGRGIILLRHGVMRILLHFVRKSLSHPICGFFLVTWSDDSASRKPVPPRNFVLWHESRKWQPNGTCMVCGSWLWQLLCLHAVFN